MSFTPLLASAVVAMHADTNTYSHGAPGVSNTAEAAIWAVDYMLQAATLGIRRVHFHNGLGYRYNLFQPASGLEDGLNITRPHILPLYHAFLIVNEAIGTSNSSGADGDGGLVRIAELGTLDRSLSAYGIWQGDKLVRMVLIDSGLFLGPTQGGGPRGQLEIELDGLPNGNKTRIRAKRLHTPRTNSYSGLSVCLPFSSNHSERGGLISRAGHGAANHSRCPMEDPSARSSSKSSIMA